MIRHRTLLSVTLVCLATGALGCRRSTSEDDTPSGVTAPAASVARVTIWVTRAGAIELDGRTADLPAVGTALSALKTRKGTVFYGRDAAEEDPHPTAMKVIEKIVAQGLPVRFSVARDFSDVAALSPAKEAPAE